MKTKRIPVEHAAHSAAHFATHGAKHSAARSATPVFSFESPEHQTYEKGPGWYVTIGLLVALLITYAIYDRAWSFGLALAVSFSMYYWFLFKQKPKMLNVKITKTGVKIGAHEYNYNQISCFWIINRPHDHKINIRLKRHFMPDVTLFLGNSNPEPIRHYLKEKVQEIEKNEGVADTLVKIFRI